MACLVSHTLSGTLPCCPGTPQDTRPPLTPRRSHQQRRAESDARQPDPRVHGPQPLRNASQDRPPRHHPAPCRADTGRVTRPASEQRQAFPSPEFPVSRPAVPPPAAAPPSPPCLTDFPNGRALAFRSPRSRPLAQSPRRCPVVAPSPSPSPNPVPSQPLASRHAQACWAEASPVRRRAPT